MKIKVSDRVQEQQPLFIREDYTEFYTLLEEYYKSQQKTGRPYDIANNLIEYFDIDQYNSITLTDSTTLLSDIGYYDNIINVESVSGFQETDGSLMIDNEVIYYETVSKSPSITLTPGISQEEFDSRYQILESILSYLVPTGNPATMKNTYPLKVAGIPVSPLDEEHLIVSLYGKVLKPGVDYNIDNTNIVFTQTPREKTTNDGEGLTYIKYLLGFASNRIQSLDEITCVQNKKIYPATLDSAEYVLRSEILSIVTLNGVLLEPYIDYTFGSLNQIQLTTQPTPGHKLYIRSIEYTAKEVGSGAVAISKIENGLLVDILVKNYGSGYSANFVPKVSIVSNTINSRGNGAAAVALIDGVKTINLLSGGSGYTSSNPPFVTFDDPAENGTIAVAEAIIDDTTGSVSQVNILSSGSSYPTPPKIKFVNPSGAKITPNASIDGDGKIIASSLQILNGGIGYTTAPIIYIDSPTAEGSNPAVLRATLSNGQVSGFVVLSTGNGYTTEPRVRIIDPVGAQILDVTVVNGSVTNIELLTGGSGYIDAPSVYIVDNRKDISGIPYGGSGATAGATIFNGSITDINITAFGSGYSTLEPPTVFISPPPEAKASSEVGVGEVTGFVITNSGDGNYESSSFNGCSRGVSGVVDYDKNGEQVFSSELISRSRQHASGSKIINLDALFLLQIFEKFTKQYLPDLTIDYTKVNSSQIVKTIKEFYLSKGTKNALEYIFKILYGETISVSYPKDEIFKPSSATWSVDTILRAKLVKGDPNNLVNSVLYQYDDSVDPSVKFASALIENVISIYVGDTQIYEIAISEETKTGTFVIPYRTKLVESIDTETNILTVDSTLGWPERNGTVLIGGPEDNIEYIQYKEKSLNQFIECTRAKNNIIDDWDAGTEISSDIFVFVNKDTSNEVILKIVGIAEASTTVLTDTGSYYLPGDKLTVAKLGATTTNEKITNWLYNVKKLVQIENITPGGINNQTATVYCTNPHGLLVGDQVTVYGANPIVYNGSFEVSSRISDNVFSYVLPQPAEFSPQGNILISVDLNKGKSDEFAINNSISKFTTNIQNTFFNNEYAYIASTGIPNYKIGPFLESALIPGNQRKLNRFPLFPNTTSVRKDILSGPIATWINGVSGWSFKSNNYVTYGGITSVQIISSGVGYDAANPPILSFNGGQGSGAEASVTIDGSISSFDVTNGGSGYTDAPLVSIVGGGGSGATARAIVTNGLLTQILVDTPGSGYTSEPIISISGGGGYGATATADVRGPISKVNLISSGANYTSIPNAVLSSGSGAEAQPIIINGRVVSIAVISSGQGYTTAPNVYINGDGFGAKAKAVIGTVGEDKGKVIGVTITNRGVGYTQGITTIRLESIGEGAIFQTNVFNWFYDLEYELQDRYDAARGYVFAGYNTQFGGEYAHVSNPQTLRYVLGDNVFKNSNQIIQENEGTFLHSPILGWAFDGNPIYGPYGYTDATDSSKGVRRMRTSYKLKTNIVYNIDTNPEPIRTDGPPLELYEAGSFIQDYEYGFGYGDLDEYNGRFCKTPEYPTGTYAYFVTIDASAQGNPQYPYIIGPQYYSSPDNWNLSQSAVQFSIPKDVVRYRDPYEDVDIDTDRQPNARTDFITTEAGETIIFEIQDSNNDGVVSNLEEIEVLELTEEQALEIFDYFPKVDIESKVDIEVETTTKFESAQIDGFVIENPGINYKVNDKVTFDNTGTDGFGASAKVETVQGTSILSYTSTYTNNQTVATITTEEDHGLVIGDVVVIETEPALDTNFKNFKVKTVAGLETVAVTQEGTGYITDIPPEYELISDSGQDAVIQLNLEDQGRVKTVDIINSGNAYSDTNPPQIRITHPQIFKKANYFVTEFDSINGKVEWYDSYVAEDRSIYACGRLLQSSDKISILAKFNNDGRLIWKRTLTPILPSSGAKDAVWKKLVVVETNPHTIYVVGETSQNTVNITYNPDILVAKYISGFNAQNQPDGILQWQKELAGISGATRRDYATAIDWSSELELLLLGGYTDTNTVSGNDMWFILMNDLGDVIEKRKVTTDSEEEKLTDVIFYGENIYFSGIIGGEDIVYGKLSYDNVNLNFDWGRRIPNPVNYKFVDAQIQIDDYDSLYLYATESNDSTGNTEKVTLVRIDLDNYADLVWAKRISPTATTFTSIKGVGIAIDVFNNITIGISVVGTTSSVDVVKFKHSGEILKDSRILVNQTFRGSSISVDSSADVFVLGQASSDTYVVNYSGNAVNSSAQSRFGGTSLALDGTGDYISAPSSTNFAFGLEDFTVEMWARPTTFSNPSGATSLIDFRTTNTQLSVALYLQPDGKVYAYIDGATRILSTTLLTLNSWNHIAYSRQSGIGRLFINGTLQTSTYTDSNNYPARGFRIGQVFGDTGLTGYNFTGNIDEVRISKGISRYNATFTPATSAFDRDLYTKMLLHFNVEVEYDISILTKLDNNHTKLGSYTFSDLYNISSINITDITYSIDEDYNPSTMSNYNEGSAGYQLLDFSDAISAHLPGSYTFVSNTSNYSTRTATIPTPSGRPLKVATDVIKKYYLRDSLVTKADNIKKITFNQNANFEVGQLLQWYTIQGTGAAAQDVVSAYGSIIETGDNYALIGKVYGTLNTTSRLKDDVSSINQLSYTFTDVAFYGTLGTFQFALSNYTSDIPAGTAEFKDFNPDDYTLKIVATEAGSSFLPGDIVSIGYNNVNITFDSTYQIATITGLTAVNKVTLISNLKKIVKASVITRTDEIGIVTSSAHNYSVGDIIFVEGFLYNIYNGSFFVKRKINSREYVYGLRDIATVDPITSSTISAVQIYAKHPSLVFVRGHQYIFDVGDSSNTGYYLSFSKDNQYKLEYSFNNVTRNGNAGIDPPGVIPYVRFKTIGDVTNISYYFDPSHIASNSPVGTNSFIDVVDTPYKGKFRITATPTSKQFKFALEREPEGPVILDSTKYSTTSTKASGPINAIKLVNKGGFYKKLPIVTNIASDRQIDRINITNGGTEYALGVYREVPIYGDGEGGKVNITVELGGDPVTGTITKVDLIDPGKGYTTGYIDIDLIPGILGTSLSGSGAIIDVVIPPQGEGASVFLQGTAVGKIKKLKNNNFGYDYPHDYTLKPEITFPNILQLFNTSVLTEIKVTDPGAGYTSPPAVVISGGGGTGAVAVATVKNNRLQEIVVKDPGSGYSSEPVVTLKSEFNYVVNVDLGYFQFNFPHGITSTSEVSLRADDIGSTIGALPQPSSAGLTSLIAGQTYYAIAGESNGLEDNQLRIALTEQDALNGQFITFLNSGSGKQILLTEVFGGKAEALVETSRFLQGEKIYQGNDANNPTAVGYVSKNDGWQIGPRLLKVVDYTGDWIVGEKVTGLVSKASGTIDNINSATGTLNIGPITQTPGKFIDNVGKPSEIVQKIQDSYFYQDFSYVVNSDIPINQWRNTVRKLNHPAGFNLFGQLNLSGGKDLSGRKVSTDFTKRVDISEFTNFSEITNFAAAQPIYTEFSNTDVLFRNKRLTSSEEILTSVVKKIDDISSQFDGIQTSFPLKINGEQVIATTGQSMILINGIVQSAGSAYTISSGNIQFTEPPKPAATVVYREIEFEQIPVKRISLTNISGIFPEIKQQVRGLTSNAVATVISSSTGYLDVINIIGSFQVNETIIASATGLNAQITGINTVIQDTIFKFGEQITNLFKKTAIIEEINLASSLPIYPTQVSAWNNLTAQTAQRFQDASNLITSNRTYIIENAFSAMQTQFPAFVVPGGAGANDKCKRDLGYIIDALIKDIKGGGNSNTVAAISAYFSNGSLISNGLLGEQTQSIYAFQQLRDLCKQAVTNQLPTKDVDILPDKVLATNGGANPNTNTNLNPNNCSDVRSAIDTLIAIVTTPLTTGVITSLPYPNPGAWNIGSSTNKLIISRTSGTSKFETGLFELQLDDYFISAETSIVGKITKLNPYRDPATNQIVSQLQINSGSTFFGMFYERLPLPQNPNTIVDDISKSIIGASKIDNYSLFVNQNYPLSEYAQNINLVYDNATGSWTNGDYIRNTKIKYVNATGAFTVGESIRTRKIIYKNKSTGTFFPDYRIKGKTSGAYADIIGVNSANAYLYVKPPSATFTSGETLVNWDVTNVGTPKVRLASRPEFRYLDAADRIEANRELIKEEVIGYIANKYPDFYYPNSPTSSYRYKDSANLIRANIDYIVATSFAAIATQYPAFTNPNPTKCKRDLRYVVQAIAQDLYDGGNKWTRMATLSYFSGSSLLTNGLVGEQTESVYAFNFAKTLCKQAITNQLSVKDLTITADPNPSSGTSSNTNANSCTNVQNTIETLFSILTTAISSGSTTSIPTLNSGEFSPGENTCKRDLSYLIDAIKFDLQYGGNSSTVNVGDYYVDGNGNIQYILGEETQSRAAFKYARDLMIAAMRNFTVTLPSTVRTGSSTTLTVSSTVGLVEGMDITGTGFNADTKIVSITNDTTLVMNQNPQSAGSGNAIFTLNYAKYSILSPSNDSTLTVDASNPTCANVASSITTLWQTLDGIISTKVVPTPTTPSYNCKFGTAAAAFGVSNLGTNNIKIDNAEKLDLGTTNFTIEMWIYKTVNATTQYILDMRTGSTSQIVPTLYFNTLNQLIYYTNGAARITANTTVPVSTWTHVAVVRKSGTTKMYIGGVLQSQIYADTNNYIGQTLRIGSSYQDNSGLRGLMDDFRLSISARYDAAFTPATEEFDDDSADLVSFHFNGLNGTTEIYPESYVSATYDSLRTSVAVIGQIDTINKEFTVEAIDASRQEYKDAAEYIQKNREFIIDEMIGYLKNKYPLLVMPGDEAGGLDGTNLCARDTGYILDGIINDLINGGNYNTVYTAKYYLEKSGALRFINGELLQSVYAYQKVGEIINSILLDTITVQYSDIVNVPVTAAASTTITDSVTSLCNTITDILAPTGNRFRDAANLLYFNKKYIAEEVAETIEQYFKWTNTSSGVTYDLFTNPNTQTCIRDLRDYLIPAMITDLLTGGNNATLAAFEYYIDSNTNILYVEDELLAMYRALEVAKPLAQKSVNNLLYSKNSTSTPTGSYVALYTTTAAYRDLTLIADGGSNQNPSGCANVTSAISTLFDLLLNIISEQSSQYSSSDRRSAAKLLIFNKNYITQEAYNETKTAYSSYPGNVSFGIDIVNDMIYDLIANGNGKTYARALSWLDAFYNFTAFSGYNPIHLIYHLERIRVWSGKAISQTLNSTGPTSGAPRYSEVGLSVGSTTTYIDNLITFLKLIVNTPSQITAVTRDPGITLISPTYATRTIPVPYTLSMEPSAFIYGDTSTSYAEVASIMQNKFKIRQVYSRFNITLGGVGGNPPRFIEGEIVTASGGRSATVYQTYIDDEGAGYVDLIDITGGTITTSTILTGDVSTAIGTVTSKDNRLMLQPFMGEFNDNEIVYSQASSTVANIAEWNYNSGAIIDNTLGILTLDTETISGEFNKSDLVYASESDIVLTCMDAIGTRTPLIGEYVRSTTITQIQLNTGSIVTSGNSTDAFVQKDKLDVIANNLPTGEYATIISYDTLTGVMVIGNKTSNFDSTAQVLGNTVGVYRSGTLQPKIYSNIVSVTTTASEASAKITRIEESTSSSFKIWLGEIEGTFNNNAQLISGYGYECIILLTNEVVSRTSRYSRGFDGQLTSFKLTTNNGSAYFPDTDGHLLVFVNGILQPPGADYAYTVFADNIQFSEAPAAGSQFHAYYLGKLRLLDDISFDFDSLRSSFNLKLAGTFYSITVTSGVQSNIILPENNIIVAVNGVLQEPGIGFKLVGSRITFTEIPRAGSSFVAFSYIGSDADVVSASVVPPVEIGDELFIEGEEYNREVAVIESSNSLITFEYSGSVKGRNGFAVAEIVSGRLDTAFITAPGSGYISRPSVEILSPTGFDSQVLARVGVYRVDIADGGTGYSYPSISVDTEFGSVTGFAKVNSDARWTDLLVFYNIPGTGIVVTIAWPGAGSPEIYVINGGDDDYYVGQTFTIPGNLISHTGGGNMIIEVTSISV